MATAARVVEKGEGEELRSLYDVLLWAAPPPKLLMWIDEVGKRASKDSKRFPEDVAAWVDKWQRLNSADPVPPVDNLPEGQEPIVIDYNKPIRTFYDNMVYHGVRFSIGDDGGLKVENSSAVPPVAHDAIRQRARHLVEHIRQLEKRQRLDELSSRELTNAEVAECKTLAAELGVELEWETVSHDLNCWGN